jgi:hypothetical protein
MTGKSALSAFVESIQMRFDVTFHVEQGELLLITKV